MVSLEAEPIFKLGFFTVTNTFINTLFVDSILIGLALFVHKKISYIPGAVQNMVELVIETYYNLIEQIASERVKMIFPPVMTFFLFILVSNWSGLLPGVGTIGIFEIHDNEKKLIPIMRAATSDLNVTFALAIVSAFLTHFFSVKLTGIKDYASRFISLNPINLFIGILELISEITKVVSLSFRLFGNIFAGEVVITTVFGLFAFVFPLPFLMLETIVGIVQALVFSMLTMSFMVIMTTPHHIAEHPVESKTKGKNK